VLALEPAMDALFERLVPGFAKACRGASDEQIAALEALAQRPLPRFYRWFLSRVGVDMGPLEMRSLDFSVDRVKWCYASRLVKADGRLLLVAYATDPASPFHLYYDLERPARDDALLVKRHEFGKRLIGHFETLQEMLVWGLFSTERVTESPRWCAGIIADEEGEVVAKLAPVMERLGFTQPIVTGPYCGIFEREGVTLITEAELGDPPLRHGFELGGPDTTTLRHILGAMADQAALRVKVDEWTPPLAP